MRSVEDQLLIPSAGKSKRTGVVVNMPASLLGLDVVPVAVEAVDDIVLPAVLVRGKVCPLPFVLAKYWNLWRWKDCQVFTIQ